MPFQPVPLCSIVELIYVWNSQRVENTIWVEHGTAPTATLLQNLCGGIITWWNTELRSAMSQDIELVLVEATYKGAETGPQASDAVGLPIAGAVPTGSTGNGTAFVVKFQTASIGRSYRGRNYVPGAPSSAVVNSVFTTAHANDVLGAYSSLTAVLEVFGCEHVVVSRFSGGALRPSGIATPVTGYIATTNATRAQRRRNPGIGN